MKFPFLLVSPILLLLTNVFGDVNTANTSEDTLTDDYLDEGILPMDGPDQASKLPILETEKQLGQLMGDLFSEENSDAKKCLFIGWTYRRDKVSVDARSEELKKCIWIYMAFEYSPSMEDDEEGIKEEASGYYMIPYSLRSFLSNRLFRTDGHHVFREKLDAIVFGTEELQELGVFNSENAMEVLISLLKPNGILIFEMDAIEVKPLPFVEHKKNPTDQVNFLKEFPFIPTHYTEKLVEGVFKRFKVNTEEPEINDFSGKSIQNAGTMLTKIVEEAIEAAKKKAVEWLKKRFSTVEYFTKTSYPVYEEFEQVGEDLMSDDPLDKNLLVPFYICRNPIHPALPINRQNSVDTNGADLGEPGEVKTDLETHMDVQASIP